MTKLSFGAVKGLERVYTASRGKTEIRAWSSHPRHRALALAPSAWNAHLPNGQWLASSSPLVFAQITSSTKGEVWSFLKSDTGGGGADGTTGRC